VDESGLMQVVDNRIFYILPTMCLGVILVNN
jgi:hypothetical protein